MHIQGSVIHRVKPDGHGHERVYAVLDGFIPDGIGLRRNCPYDLMSEFDFVPDTTRPISEIGVYGFIKPKAWIHGIKAEVVHDITDSKGGYTQRGKINITDLLSVEFDTREPDEVVVRSSVLSEERIRKALQGVD